MPNNFKIEPFINNRFNYMTVNLPSLNFSLFSGVHAEPIFKGDSNQRWYEAVVSRIPRHLREFETRLLPVEQASSHHEGLMTLIHAEYLDGRKPLGDSSPSVFIGSSFTMSGLAIVATYLRQKNKLEGLYVCQSLEALRVELVTISRKVENVRVALVVPTRNYLPRERYVQTEARHRVAICVEKIGKLMRIAVLETMGIPAKALNPSIVRAHAADLKKTQVNLCEVVFWYIFHSRLDFENTKIYHVPIRREFAVYGCDTFALRDGVTFLRCPDFFSLIEKKKTIVRSEDDKLKLRVITTLPPEFMKGTQSTKAVRKYLSKNPEFAERTLSHEGKTPSAWKLEECVAKHSVQLKGPEGTKIIERNYYIHWRSYKYKLLALFAAKFI